MSCSDGPPIVLLHGPGEFTPKWLRVIPDLVSSHRVIAPDLPGHGASEGADTSLDAERVLAWLGELIERTCPPPPTLVGHTLGGAIAARFAIKHGDRLDRLVLVDSLGLAPFRPAPSAKAVGRQMREIGLPRIPLEDLARITVPTTLIWGRHDRANRLQLAEAASARYGWPLHVMGDCADDPARDQPEAFLRALRAALETVAEEEAIP